MYRALALLVLAAIQPALSACVPRASFKCRNRFDPREYNVLLDNNGPSRLCMPPPIMAPPITTKPITEPIRMLPPPPISPPRVVAKKCICYKTIVKPQVYQRVITVPKILRFLKKTYRPVVEKIPYEAKPKLASPSSLLTPLNARRLDALRALPARFF